MIAQVFSACFAGVKRRVHEPFLTNLLEEALFAQLLQRAVDRVVELVRFDRYGQHVWLQCEGWSHGLQPWMVAQVAQCRGVIDDRGVEQAASQIGQYRRWRVV